MVSKRNARSGQSAATHDLSVTDNGMVFADGEDRLEYLWFRLVEREAGREYPLHRVVRLQMLRYLPQEARQEAGLLDTMRAALTGVYNQRVAEYDPCMIVAGIFDPPLGVIQCYGAIGVGDTLGQAAHSASLGLGAVQGVMANFPQSRLERLDTQKAEWLRRAFLGMKHSLVVIGQPDPRLSARGMGREGPAEKQNTLAGETVYTMQQNEMLFRSLARLQEEFLFLVLASRLPQRDLATMLEGIASEASVPASRQTGTKAISIGLSLPLIASGGMGDSASTAFGEAESQSSTEGLAESDSTTHFDAYATTVGHSVTDSEATTNSRATTVGHSESAGVTVSEGRSHSTAHADGSSHATSRATTVGSSSSTRINANTGASLPGPTISSGVQTPALVQRESEVDYGSAGNLPEQLNPPEVGAGDSGIPGYYATAQVDAGRDAVAARAAEGGYVSFQVPGDSADVAAKLMDAGLGMQAPSSLGATVPTGKVTTTSKDAAVLQPGSSVAISTPLAPTVSRSVSIGHTAGTSHSETTSEANTTSRSDSVSDGVQYSVALVQASGKSHSATSSQAHTVGHAETHSTSTTASTSDGTTHGIARSQSSSRTSGTSIGRTLAASRTMGMSAGLIPSVSGSKSYQWQDDKAIQLTAILRAQEELLRQATLEGAYLADAYLLCRTERGSAAAEAAVRQAFHGSEPPVVTPVQTRQLTQEEQDYIRLHAMCFTQSTREETVAGALETYKDSTLLLPLQLAAYMAPGLFEEGAAVTTQERIPAFAFVPDMEGDVVLGHLWSTETGALTSAQLRLSEDRFFHTAFAADTGYGKTVAAERLALETTRLWKHRTVVLDFGAGWRRMLNAPLGEAGRVDVWQVFPGAVVPFRWNPLQVGRRVNPEQQMRATCELVRNAGRMGPRQLGYMRRALKALYLEHGVLTSFKEVLADKRWNTVQEDEWDVVNATRNQWEKPSRRRKRGLHLDDLESFEQQALAVHRSKQVDMVMWYEELIRMYHALPRRATTDRTSLEGVLLRIEPFAEGQMESMYGRGEGSLAVEDLGSLRPRDDAWGISVLEGGAEMDEFAKTVVFSLVAWHLYHDAVVRRRQSIGKRTQRKLQIYFEEANKVLSGVAVDAGDRDGGSAGQTSEIWRTMWRDGRKYGIWLHAIAQTVSELPEGILSSENNAFFGQTKNPKDRDLIMAHLAFSERGFTDEDYRRFLSRMPAAMAICKLGYSQDVIHTTPFLCRPAMVPALEPTDREILANHMAMQSARRGHANGA
jgi:hypothetical protein